MAKETQEKVDRKCGCMDHCKGSCGYKSRIGVAKSAVEAQLPEDEPDCTAAWVYRTIFEVATS